MTLEESKKIFKQCKKTHKEDLNTAKYILYQVKHYVRLDDVIQNLGYIKNDHRSNVRRSNSAFPESL